MPGKGAVANANRVRGLHPKSWGKNVKKLCHGFWAIYCKEGEFKAKKDKTHGVVAIYGTVHWPRQIRCQFFAIDFFSRTFDQTVKGMKATS